MSEKTTAPHHGSDGLDQSDEDALYEAFTDDELEIAAMGGRPGSDTGNGKPTSTPICCSAGHC